MIKVWNEYNGEIKVFDNEKLLGKICRGCVYGEWWVEPIDGKPSQLIAGKKNAINYLK